MTANCQASWFSDRFKDKGGGTGSTTQNDPRSMASVPADVPLKAAPTLSSWWCGVKTRYV